ncbi:unnamed protein product [Amoebophrya sp. A25]|nr:unnamed protein product [Amoebophrya sp. A25]
MDEQVEDVRREQGALVEFLEQEEPTEEEKLVLEKRLSAFEELEDSLLQNLEANGAMFQELEALLTAENARLMELGRTSHLQSRVRGTLSRLVDSGVCDEEDIAALEETAQEHARQSHGLAEMFAEQLAAGVSSQQVGDSSAPEEILREVREGVAKLEEDIRARLDALEQRAPKEADELLTSRVYEIVDAHSADVVESLATTLAETIVGTVEKAVQAEMQVVRDKFAQIRLALKRGHGSLSARDQLLQVQQWRVNAGDGTPGDPRQDQEDGDQTESANDPSTNALSEQEMENQPTRASLSKNQMKGSRTRRVTAAQDLVLRSTNKKKRKLRLKRSRSGSPASTFGSSYNYTSPIRTSTGSQLKKMLSVLQGEPDASPTERVALEELKDVGNKLYLQAEFEMASEFFTKAIAVLESRFYENCPTDQASKTILAVLYGNRSQCYLMMAKEAAALAEQASTSGDDNGQEKEKRRRRRVSNTKIVVVHLHRRMKMKLRNVSPFSRRFSIGQRCDTTRFARIETPLSRIIWIVVTHDISIDVDKPCCCSHLCRNERS